MSMDMDLGPLDGLSPFDDDGGLAKLWEVMGPLEEATSRGREPPLKCGHHQPWREPVRVALPTSAPPAQHHDVFLDMLRDIEDMYSLAFVQDILSSFFISLN